MGVEVGLLIGGRNEPWRWRIRSADEGDESRRDQAPTMGSNFSKIGPSVAELWALASRMGVEGGLLIGGRNEPWRWRIRSADEGDESRRDQAPTMGSNFGKIGPSVAELWASASAVGIMGVASRMGVEVGLLIGGRNEPWVVEDTQRRWGDESRRDQAPTMGSNFGKIGPSVV
jgi:hypothetical protein